MTKYFSIIPAAGLGERFSSDIPKQHLHINNIPILQHSIEPFLQSDHIEKVVVVLNQKDTTWETLSIANHPKITTTFGGKVRMESVLNGLSVLDNLATGIDWVIVHDGVRPFLNINDLHKLMKVVGDHPVGGIIGVSVQDTIKKVSPEGEVIETIDRTSLWHAHTPQMFRFALLKSALQSAIESDVLVTDESSAVERLGHRPLIVQGQNNNTKITFTEDLALVEEI